MATASLSVPDTHKDVPESTAETDSAVVETEPDNNSKLRTFLGILRRLVPAPSLSTMLTAQIYRRFGSRFHSILSPRASFRTDAKLRYASGFGIAVLRVQNIGHI
jgi:hypothetical protein